jgi:hypothetical protein
MTARRVPREAALEKVGLTLDEILEAVAADENRGWCLHCGAEAYGVEPDARRYPCESCQRNAVYGAEEILIMNA